VSEETSDFDDVGCELLGEGQEGIGLVEGVGLFVDVRELSVVEGEQNGFYLARSLSVVFEEVLVVRAGGGSGSFAAGGPTVPQGIEVHHKGSFPTDCLFGGLLVLFELGEGEGCLAYLFRTTHNYNKVAPVCRPAPQAERKPNTL
jgi:hypothetical protein